MAKQGIDWDAESSTDIGADDLDEDQVLNDVFGSDSSWSDDDYVEKPKEGSSKSLDSQKKEDQKSVTEGKNNKEVIEKEDSKEAPTEDQKEESKSETPFDKEDKKQDSDEKRKKKFVNVNPTTSDISSADTKQSIEDTINSRINAAEKKAKEEQKQSEAPSVDNSDPKQNTTEKSDEQRPLSQSSVDSSKQTEEKSEPQANPVASESQSDNYKQRIKTINRMYANGSINRNVRNFLGVVVANEHLLNGENSSNVDKDQLGKNAITLQKQAVASNPGPSTGSRAKFVDKLNHGYVKSYDPANPVTSDNICQVVDSFGKGFDKIDTSDNPQATEFSYFGGIPDRVPEGSEVFDNYVKGLGKNGFKDRNIASEYSDDISQEEPPVEGDYVGPEPPEEDPEYSTEPPVNKSSSGIQNEDSFDKKDEKTTKESSTVSDNNTDIHRTQHEDAGEDQGNQFNVEETEPDDRLTKHLDTINKLYGIGVINGATRDYMSIRLVDQNLKAFHPDNVDPEKMARLENKARQNYLRDGERFHGGAEKNRRELLDKMTNSLGYNEGLDTIQDGLDKFKVDMDNIGSDHFKDNYGGSLDEEKAKNPQIYKYLQSQGGSDYKLSKPEHTKEADAMMSVDQFHQLEHENALLKQKNARFQQDMEAAAKIFNRYLDPKSIQADGKEFDHQREGFLERGVKMIGKTGRDMFRWTRDHYRKQQARRQNSPDKMSSGDLMASGLMHTAATVTGFAADCVFAVPRYVAAAAYGKDFIGDFKKRHGMHLNVMDQLLSRRASRRRQEIKNGVPNWITNMLPRNPEDSKAAPSESINEYQY